jgi:hypothetical protein
MVISDAEIPSFLQNGPRVGFRFLDGGLSIPASQTVFGIEFDRNYS